MTGFVVRQLTGRLPHGMARERGRFHALLIGSSGETGEFQPAVCGTRPGFLGGSGFVEPVNPEQAVTCPRCLRRLKNSYGVQNEA